MLEPGETDVIDLALLQDAGAIPKDASWASAAISFNGRAGEVVPIAASYDSSGRYGLQSPFKSDLSFMYRGGMWHVDASHNTLLTTGNGGSKPANVAVSLLYGNNASYDLRERKLAPGEQMWVEVGQLIRNQIPDKNRKFLPPDVTSGSYQIVDLDDQDVGYLFEGEVMTDGTYGASTYGCAPCCGFDDTQQIPNPYTAPIGTTEQFLVQALNDCTGAWQEKAGQTWRSTNGGVATVNTSGLASCVGAGAATISSTVQLREPGVNRCVLSTFSQSSGVTVVRPTAVEPINTIAQGNAVCPTGMAGWSRKVTNQLQDQLGHAVAFSGISMADTLTTGSPNDLGLTGTVTGSDTTDSSGDWPDSYFACSKACPGSTGQTDSLQSWTYNGLGLPHVNQVVYKCSSASVDGR